MLSGITDDEGGAHDEREASACEPEMFGQRPTYALIDLDALASNFHFIRRKVGPHVKVMAVVKANAYGHGAVACAQRLASEGADWFGVALPEEGIKLRESGIAQPILCLAGFWEGQETLCLRYNLVPAVYRLDTIEALDRAAREAGALADVHVKIDTGMGRLGVRYHEASEFADALKKFQHIRVSGLMTHFAAADVPVLDGFTDEQVRRFEQAKDAFRARGFEPVYEDLANSAGAYAHANARGNMIRPGGLLYGLWRDILPPVGEDEEQPPLRPVMSVRSRIMLLKLVQKGETLGYGCTFEAARPTLVATLPIGYNDGYVRALSNRGRVIVRGAYAPVVGRISMDLTLVDVTDVENVSLHDSVTLLGHAGALSVTAEDIALTANTLSYEITCGISARVPKYYKAQELHS